MLALHTVSAIMYSGCDDTANRTNKEKYMSKSTRNTGTRWTQAQVATLRQLARHNTPTRVIGLKLGRTATAVQSQASAKGISLKPTNQSPYGRRG
jgi:predicted RNA-binding protein with PUA-like domain